MKCFILAGGFATRLWPLTEKRAKPLLPMNGLPLLTHLVSKVPQDIPIIVSTNAVFADDMKQWAKTISKRNIEIYIEDAGHEKEKLGALGALAKWMEAQGIDDDVLLLAGDNYFAFDLTQIMRAFSGNPILIAYDVREKELAKRFGTVIIDEKSGNPKRVIAFEEKPSHPKSTLISTGCSIIPQSSAPIVQEYAKRHPDNIGGIFEEFLRRNVTVECLITSELWRDIGSFAVYLHTHEELLNGKQHVDPTAKIDAQSQLIGSVSVGTKTRIEKSTLTNCVVFGNSTIKNCVLTDCIIDDGCILEGVDISKQMLRAKTTLRV